MQISMSINAYNNITDIINYTSKISTNYANKIVNNIYSKINLLKFSPYIGRYVPELSYKHYRERIYKEFRIIYFVHKRNYKIYIRYIISGKRNSYLFFKNHKRELTDFLKQFSI